MRAIKIYRNGALAGTLIEENPRHFIFRYENNYFNDSTKPSISLTLPKTQREYSSEFLFPFFFNMLSEAVNRKLLNPFLEKQPAVEMLVTNSFLSEANKRSYLLMYSTRRNYLNK